MMDGLHETHLYVAGFGNADWEVIFRSAAITACLIALASVAYVLIASNKKKK